ncbi:Hypothetical predicted protein [Paramuricea clavata]|uniref:Uncharacterized protein n=1 Tax=Paramuricea clavata TaxID=317549 RepID=A0A6S7FYD1_PARCT|nr:Hypothetical predicted protein [Paramuricea clavata]
MAQLQQQIVQVDEETPALIIDTYVDQYGHLLTDVRGVCVGQTTHILPQWTLAEECVASGWAYTMPLHILPDRVGLAFKEEQNLCLGTRNGRKTIPSPPLMQETASRAAKQGG